MSLTVEDIIKSIADNKMDTEDLLKNINDHLSYKESRKGSTKTSKEVTPKVKNSPKSEKTQSKCEG